MPRSDGLGPLRPRATELALQLFADQGYAETSMRDISHRLDVTTAALYYHFENKDDLLLAALTPALDELEALLAKAPKATANRRAFLGSYTELLLKHQVAMRLINRDPAVAAHPAIQPRLVEVEAGVSKHLSNRRGARARALSVAAVGAVLMPVLTLDRSELTGLTDVLVQGAMAVLGG